MNIVYCDVCDNYEMAVDVWLLTLYYYHSRGVNIFLLVMENYQTLEIWIRI